MEQNLYFLYFITVLQDYVKFIKENEAQFQSYFVQFKSFFLVSFWRKHISLSYVFILILKCSKWSHIPLNRNATKESKAFYCIECTKLLTVCMTTLSTITGVIVTLGSQKSVVFQLKNVREKGIK